MDDNVIICRCQEITYGEIVRPSRTVRFPSRALKSVSEAAWEAARANTASTLSHRSFPKRPVSP